MNKPAPPPETLGSVPLNSGQSSNGKPYGRFTVNSKWVPNAVGELRKEVDPEGRITKDVITLETPGCARTFALFGGRTPHSDCRISAMNALYARWGI